MIQAPVQLLKQKFVRIVGFGVVPVIALLGIVGANDYRRARIGELDRHRQAVLVRQAGLEQVAAGIHQHVSVMRQFTTMALDNPTVVSNATSRRTLTPTQQADQMRGVALGIDGSEQSWASREMQAAGEALFPLQRAFRQSQPSIQWSYLFDAARTVVTIYPSPPPLASAEEFQSWFEYDIFREALPDRNPRRSAYWTPVYMDAGGAGLMVSHGAPVYNDDTFRGLVGADILLSAMSRYLEGFGSVDGHLAVADQNDMVVAMPGLADLTQVISVTETFGLKAPSGVGTAFIESGDRYVLRFGIAGTPWRMLYVLPQASVRNAALLATLPYLAISGGVMISLLILYAALARSFVGPAVQLADFVEGAAANARRTAVPNLPQAWQPWLERVIASLDHQRRLMSDKERAESLKAAVIDAALDAVIVADQQGRIVQFNPGAERIFGYRRDQAIGERISDLIVPPELRSAHEEGMRRFTQTGVPRVLGRRVEIEAMRADGTIFPAEIAILQVGQEAVFAAYLRDLTDHRAASAAIERQQQHIHQMEKLSAMGSLLAGVAHELNNPLAILVAQATLLRDKAETEDVARRAERIHAAAQRSGRIVKSFLAMARQKPPERAFVQLNEVIDGAFELTAYGLRSNGIEVLKQLDPNLPAIEIDRDLIGQVFANLIVNAQQALVDQTDRRWISVKSVEIADAVVVCLSDSGPGIPPEIVSRIFDPYFTTKAVGVGTGIGLSISSNIIQAHGGRIELQSSERGACFQITLPIGNSKHTAEPKPTDMIGQCLSILVVDDEPDVGNALAEILTVLGHSAVAVDDPVRALDHLQRKPFDLVFADLRMPGLDGASFAKRVAAIDPLLGTRTIIMTGDTIAGVPRAGTSLVMEKPFDRQDVVSLITRALLVDAAGGDV